MANVIWGLHTQDDHLFLNDNVIAIGWRAFGDLKAIEPTREAFKKHYEKTYPEVKRGSIATCAGMLYRFLYEVEVGIMLYFLQRVIEKSILVLLRENMSMYQMQQSMFSKEK